MNLFDCADAKRRLFSTGRYFLAGGRILVCTGAATSSSSETRSMVTCVVCFGFGSDLCLRVPGLCIGLHLKRLTNSADASDESEIEVAFLLSESLPDPSCPEVLLFFTC
jgi:hypothetical protein